MQRPILITFLVIALLALLGAALLVLLTPAKTTISPGDSTNATASCTKDSDCVIGGCSAQLCFREGTGPTFSTCEYSDRYACVKLTSCGCQQGQCAWNPTDAFTSCLQQATAPPLQ